VIQTAGIVARFIVGGKRASAGTRLIAGSRRDDDDVNATASYLGRRRTGRLLRIGRYDRKRHQRKATGRDELTCNVMHPGE